jgi:hypothetical protein
MRHLTHANRTWSLLLALLVIGCGPVEQHDQAEVERQGAFDVAVGEIHVTQGVQRADPRVWVPLVAERSIAVRVQVERVFGTPGPVTGTLRAFANGQEVTPPGGIPDLNRTFPAPHDVFVPPTTNRFPDVLAQEQDTLNFELPAERFPIAPPPGRSQAHDVHFVVEIAAAGDADPSNDIGRTAELTVIRRGTPWLFKDQLFYFPGGRPTWPVPAANQPDGTFIAPHRGDAMGPALWPIPDAPTTTGTQTNPIYPPLLYGFFFTEDCDGDGMITRRAVCFDASGRVRGDEQGLLLHRLLQRRQLLVQGGFGPDERVHLYAWVRDGMLAGHDGAALLAANVGYGHAARDDGQYVFAHEFGHMVGLDHNQPGRDLQDWGWDVGARLHANPVLMADGITGRVKLPTAYGGAYGDVMNDSPYNQTHNTWIDTASYEALLEHPRLASDEERRCPSTPHETVVVYGVPVGESLRLVTYRYPWALCLLEHLQPERAQYRITIDLLDSESDELEQRAQEIDATLITTLARGEGDERSPGPFAAAFAVPAGAELQRVTVEGIERELRPIVMERPAGQPKLSITSPRPGALLEGIATITWESAHSHGAPLTYQVAFSPDGGRSFVPLAVDLSETSVTFDAKGLPEARGEGIVRVFASDGMNTTYADVGGLTNDR